MKEFLYSQTKFSEMAIFLFETYTRLNLKYPQITKNKKSSFWVDPKNTILNERF